MNYEKLLFNEMRLFPVTIINEELTDSQMVKAMTAAENLKSLGLGLKPTDIIMLAKSSDMDTIYDRLKVALGEVKAQPMYPGFPETVMAMDEATYRFHQLVHYFSTYGIEDMLGIEVKKGWLPADSGVIDDKIKTKEQEQVLSLKYIELIDTKDMYTLPLKKIFSKRNRATLPEKEIILECIEHLDEQALVEVCKTNITFKENLLDIFNCILESLDTTNQKAILNALHELCQHTGDVMKCIRYYLPTHKYYLETSKKKLCVKLLESYPVEDLRGNLNPSAKKSKNTKLVLNYISYNKFSRSEAHKQVVKDFRDGKVRSWESSLKLLMDKDPGKVIEYAGQRPGMLVRMVAWLVRLGYDPKEIEAILVENAKPLSVQTLVELLNHFGNYENIDKKETVSQIISKSQEYDLVYEIFTHVLKERLKYLDTTIKDKKVYIDQEDFEFNKLTVMFNSASQDGGYLRSGTTFKIPDTADKIRFFIYWNDEWRVDIDLHSYGYTKDGKYFHVGWNANYKECGIVTSGDITHSDAAEYIDIDLNNQNLKYVIMNIDVFTSQKFKDIDTCFTGLMAVKDHNDEVLYDPKNCFITHNLNSHLTDMTYGFIDVENKLLYVVMNDSLKMDIQAIADYLKEKRFSLSTYLDMLFVAQNCEVVEDKALADVVLTLDKPKDENGISLIDENYFSDK